MIEEPIDEAPVGAPAWMVTFADLMSLLLAFFVLLLSFSNTEIVKFRAAAGSVRSALGINPEVDLSNLAGSELLPHSSPREGEGQSPPQETILENASTQVLVARLRQLIEESGLEEEARLRVRPTGVSLELEGDLLFDTGKAELRAAAEPVLIKLSKFMGTIAGAIDVEGHTDNVPINSVRYPSNWELSAARAGRAVRFLTAQHVKPRRLRAIGHGATVPVGSNLTEEGRQSNRRVAFLFIASKTTLVGDIDPRLGNYEGEELDRE